MVRTNNLKVASLTPIIAPAELKQVFPLLEDAAEFVTRSREHIQNIIDNRDSRLMVVVGPCSIHDPDAAIDYARKLAKLAKELEDQLFIVMRVYFEKPRTTIGWKGLINDPDLNGTHQISKGLGVARGLLCRITGLGLPVATEMLDPITPQYMADLISWGAIGARTTESQVHREMASGLSFPVGFKNGTDGSLQIALDAMNSALHSHSFLGISNEGNITMRSLPRRALLPVQYFLSTPYWFSGSPRFQNWSCCEFWMNSIVQCETLFAEPIVLFRNSAIRSSTDILAPSPDRLIVPHG